MIVTNDDDFLNLANVKGFPPNVVLLKTGNQRNIYIEEVLIKHKEDINTFFVSEENGVPGIFRL